MNRCALTFSLVLGAAVGCGDDPIPLVDVGTDAGVDGGRSEVTFSAVVSGQEVQVMVQATEPITVQGGCGMGVALLKPLRGYWVPLTDSRPKTMGPGYYLDGQYYGPTGWCEGPMCSSPWVSPISLRAVEVIQVGSREAPEGCAFCEPGDVVPVYETQPVHGMLRVSINYSIGNNCFVGVRTAVVDVVVP